MKEQQSTYSTITQSIISLLPRYCTYNIEQVLDGYYVTISDLNDHEIISFGKTEIRELREEYTNLDETVYRFTEENDLDDCLDAETISAKFPEVQVIKGQAVLPYFEEYVARKIIETVEL